MLVTTPAPAACTVPDSPAMHATPGKRDDIQGRRTRQVKIDLGQTDPIRRRIAASDRAPIAEPR